MYPVLLLLLLCAFSAALACSSLRPRTQPQLRPALISATSTRVATTAECSSKALSLINPRGELVARYIHQPDYEYISALVVYTYSLAPEYTSTTNLVRCSIVKSLYLCISCRACTCLHVYPWDLETLRQYHTTHGSSCRLLSGRCRPHLGSAVTSTRTSSCKYFHITTILSSRQNNSEQICSLMLLSALPCPCVQKSRSNNNLLSFT